MAEALTDLTQAEDFLRAAKYRECVRLREDDPDWLDRETHYINLTALATDPGAAMKRGELHVVGSGWERLDAVAAWAGEPDFDCDLRAVVAAQSERGLRDVLLAMPPATTTHFYVAGHWPIRVIEEIFDGMALPRRESYVCTPSDFVGEAAQPQVMGLGADDYELMSRHWSRDVWDEAASYGYRIFAWVEDGQAQEFCFHWPAPPEDAHHAVHGLQGVRDWSGPQARAVVGAATAAVHALGKTANCPINLSTEREYIATFVSLGYRLFHQVHCYLGIKRGSGHFTAVDLSAFYGGRSTGPKSDSPNPELSQAGFGEGRPARKGDPIIHGLRDLAAAQGRREQGLFWAEGETLAVRAFNDGLPVECIVYTGSLLSRPNGLDLLARSRAAGVQHIRISEGMMGTLTTSRPMPAVMAAVAVRLRSSSELWSSSATRLLVADGLQSPSNLGMAIRTADAAGVDAVVVAGANADPLDKHSIRAARGAVGRLPIFACDKLPEWLDFLRDRGFEVVGATASAGTTIYEAPLNLPLAAIVGNESEGIRREVLERCSSTVAIPMAPGQDSLNVGVAAGILLYELVRRRRREVPEGSELGS